MSIHSEYDIPNESGKTRLMLACVDGLIDMCYMLIQNGSNVNAKTKGANRTPLMYAAAGDYPEICNLLIKNGADIHAKDKNNANALIIAAIHNNIDIVKLLVLKGIDINETNVDGHSALTEAACYGHKDICEFLLEMGASPFILAENKDSALIIASKIETEYGLDICNLLIKYGAHINHQNKYGMTALMYACESGIVDYVKFLINNGANIHKQDNEGCNALFYAIEIDSYECASELLQNGISVHIKHDTGTTAFDYAVLMRRRMLCDLLIQYGADCTIDDENYKKIQTYGWTDVVESIAIKTHKRNISRCKMIKEDLMAYVWNPERDYTKWSLLSDLD